jgi:hypothetical protein
MPPPDKTLNVMGNYMRTAFILIISIGIASCKKEDVPARLRFTAQERQWFIYEKDQQFKFKNDFSDSLVFTVTKVEHNYNAPEYSLYDTTFTRIVALNETYLAKLNSQNDSIIIYFYKELQFEHQPDKMKQTIRWNSVKNQFVELSAIKDHSPFSNRIVNGVTYAHVTQALPITQDVYSWTKYDYAYYDQKAGFIEIIDLNGVSWKRD